MRYLCTESCKDIGSEQLLERGSVEGVDESVGRLPHAHTHGADHRRVCDPSADGHPRFLTVTVDRPDLNLEETCSRNLSSDNVVDVMTLYSLVGRRLREGQNIDSFGVREDTRRDSFCETLKVRVDGVEFRSSVYRQETFWLGAEARDQAERGGTQDICCAHRRADQYGGATRGGMRDPHPDAAVRPRESTGCASVVEVTRRARPIQCTPGVTYETNTQTDKFPAQRGDDDGGLSCTQSISRCLIESRERATDKGGRNDENWRAFAPG